MVFDLMSSNVIDNWLETKITASGVFLMPYVRYRIYVEMSNGKYEGVPWDISFPLNHSQTIKPVSNGWVRES